MNELMETAREIVDECVNTLHCKTCSFCDDSGHCIIGWPVYWKLAADMDAEHYWDEEGGEDE